MLNNCPDVFVCGRSKGKSRSLGSKSINFPSVTPKTMKKLGCMTRCWRLIFFKHIDLSICPLMAVICCCSVQDSIPFAVIGSNVQVESKGRMVRGRAYPWGVVEGNIAEIATFWLYIHTRFRNSCVLVDVACVSGGSASLWLPVAEEHAGEDIHAGPEGCDTGDALWKVQGRAHPQNDTNGCAGQETQVGGGQVRQSLVPLSECWADTLMWLCLLVCLRSIKMTARWIFLCRWSPAMRGKDWSMKKMKRCVYLSPGSLIFHSCRGFFFLEVLFFPICSWGRCRKCWKGFRGRCIAIKVVIEWTQRHGQETTISHCCRNHGHLSTQVMGQQVRTACLNNHRRLRLIPEKQTSAFKTQQQITDQLRCAVHIHFLR